jgi:hypothetical protein
MDFNDATEQRSSDLIPAGTVLPLILTVRPGGAGEDGWLKTSKDGQSEALDCELTVLEGQYARKKLWALLTLKGTTQGHLEAGDISKSRIRAILESAYGIRPDDKSPTACAARKIGSYEDLDGLAFMGKIGIEPARGTYQARNVLLEVITPERSQWRKLTQPAARKNTPAAIATAGQPIEKPLWAQ